MFFYHYFHYYHLGYRLNNRGYQLAYNELDEFSRQIALGLILYIIGTYLIWILLPIQLIDCIVRGAILCSIALPIVHSHFSQPDKYKF